MFILHRHSDPPTQNFANCEDLCICGGVGVQMWSNAVFQMERQLQFSFEF